MAWSTRQIWAARLNAAFFSPVKAWALLDILGCEGLARAGDADWSRAAGANLEDARRLRRAAFAFDVAAEERRAAALGARLIVRGDADYPELLAAIADPPLVLYVQGTLAERPPVAFVGSRAPTAYGCRQTRRLAADAARRGLVVVSGLARGVDGEAHRAALEAKGASWAVLGTGLDHVYPLEHRGLAKRLVAEGGAVVSEMALDTPPKPELFPRRNRIVAGLSWAVVVVEGRHRSGSLITARLAGEYGREVLAVPGPADSPLSEAPHRLLSQGAALAAAVEDILAVLPAAFQQRSVTPPRDIARSPGPGDALPIEPAFAREAGSVRGGIGNGVAAEPPSHEEARILALLGGDSLSLDELVQLSGLDTARLSSIMLSLEIKERVSSVPGQRYAQKEVR